MSSLQYGEQVCVTYGIFLETSNCQPTCHWWIEVVYG